ncbi:FAS1-like dehydratase domain-containing protein [Pengzhenrongella sp.]|jgi:3-methylfumaryl-CoA hydratase|uniref:FAS1-like dehydratase domain-containing protein n=1 Tax=Pengzhenrongella sp. TaxID=2888820 RepID=UPI002F94BFA2
MNASRVVRTELITTQPSEALANLLGTDIPVGELPALWHWVHLLEKRPHADLGPDGHPTFGIPAPPGPGRKRMFAGGRVSTHSPLLFGLPATRTTWVVDTTEKQGSTGPLTFVTVRNEYTQDGRVCIVDENDIVYRTSGSSLSVQVGALESVPDEQGPAPREPALTLTADEALLFRFSALTYNAHRIHYDHNWVREEGYGDLVVHGPLQALMMGELIRRNGDGLVGRQFAYRLVSPMIGPQTFTVVAGADGVDAGVEVHDVHGALTAVSTVGPIDPEQDCVTSSIDRTL